MAVGKVKVKISLLPNSGCRYNRGCGWDVDRGRGRRAGIGAEAKGQGLGRGIGTKR